MIALMVFVTLLGLWFVVSALANWDWYHGILDFAFVEAVFGDAASRWACGLVGLGLTVAGVIGAVQSR